MAVPQRVAEEVLGTCRQPALLALRRSVLPATPIKSSRKAELISDIAAECDALADRQHIFTEVLVTWSMHELHLFIARLRGLGYMVPVGKRPRQQDLIAAIVSAGECTATAPMVSKRTRKDICSSASTAARAPAPAMSKQTRKDICSSASAAAVGDPTASCSTESSSAGVAELPGSAIEPPSCMALVAVDSAAAPLKLQQKLTKRWCKKVSKLLKKKQNKQKLKQVKDELRNVFHEHRATATVGELRAMVGQAVGLPLDGKYRLRFDRALIKLTSAPPKKRRAQRRFTIAKGSRTESA